MGQGASPMYCAILNGKSGILLTICHGGHDRSYQGLALQLHFQLNKFAGEHHNATFDGRINPNASQIDRPSLFDANILSKSMVIQISASSL